MNCHDARAALLAGERTSMVTAHLEGCVECRRAVPGIEQARSDLQSESMWLEPPAGLEDSIVASIAGPRVAEEESRSGTEVEVKRSNSWLIAVMFGFVAAVAVLVVGMFAMTSRTPDPNWRTTMSGTDVSPSASAVVAGWSVDAGTRVVLEASNLGIAPEGSVYQLWFSKGSQDVSAGTFSDPKHVELTVGIAREDYPTVWLALESITADVGEAGRVLLVSTDG